jgi:MoxR-like ATPase
MDVLLEKLRSEILKEGLPRDEVDLNYLVENYESLDEDMKKFARWGRIALKKVSQFLGKVKIFFQTVGSKVFAMYRKGNEEGIIDPVTMKVAIKWGSGTPHSMTILLNPDVYGIPPTHAPIPESKKKKTISLETIFEDETASEFQKALGKRTAELDIPLDTGELDQDEASRQLSSHKNVEEVVVLLKRFARQALDRKSVDERVPSILIQGPPGGGKTTIAKQFVETMASQWHYKILEIASLYKEILGGFPIVTRALLPNDESIRGLLKKPIASLTAEEKKMIEEYQKEMQKFEEVVLKPANILPPSGASGNYVLFLDEFNREEEKMAAAMNLCLSGSIGNTYTLPVHTLVIAAGNVGKPVDTVDVAKMDSATFSRFGATVYLGYDWLGWVDYANTKEFASKHIGKAPAIITNWVLEKTAQERTRDWSIPLKQFTTKGEGQLNPRMLSNVINQMISAAATGWEDDRLTGKKSKEFYEKGYQSAGYPNAFAYYLHYNQKQLFAEVAGTSFGAAPESVAHEILGSFENAQQQRRTLAPEDILLNWVSMPDKKKKAANAAMAKLFVTKVPFFIQDHETMSSIQKYIKEHDIKIPEEDLKEVSNDLAMYIAVNISSFTDYIKMRADDAGALFKALSEIRAGRALEAEEEEEEEEDDKTAKGKKKTAAKAKPTKYTSEVGKEAVANELADRIMTRLIEISETYSSIQDVAIDHSRKTEGKTAKFIQAFSHAKRGELVNGSEPPSYAIHHLKGKKLLGYLTVLNMQMLGRNIINPILKKAPPAEPAEEEQPVENPVEEGLRKLFSRMV